jgi:PAS domain S-box-containing protein
VNRPAVQVFGAASAAELVGLHALDLVHPDGRADVSARLSRTVGKDAVTSFVEQRRLRLDGSEFIALIFATPIDLDGKRGGIVMVRDITELRRAEQRLRDNKQRFRLLAEVSFDAILEIEGGVVREVYGRATELFGRTRDEMVGQPATAISPPDMIRDVERRISGRVEGIHESRIVQKDGTLVPIEVSAKHFERDGRRYRIAAMRDISARKRAKEQLRESEEQFRWLFEMFPYAIYVHVDDGIVFANKAAAEVFGYATADDMLGTSALALYHPEEQTEIARFRRQILDSVVQGNHDEYRLVRRDGSTFVGEGMATRTLWDGRRAVIAIICDVSERKKFIEAITAAKESAELANRTKSEFLATVSHELRTPLNAIIGFSNLMVNELLGALGNEAYKAYAADILTSGRHLHAIINDILDISKIEAGKLELADRPFSLRDILLASVKFVEGKAQQKSINLKWCAASELPHLRGDEQKVRQILTNLLSNAVKFTPERGRVTTSAAVADDGAMRVVVTDTGIGIAPGDIEKALTPFVQIESGMDRSYEGTGLGLPIAKSLAELHGGSLTIASEPGGGTTVTVRFPPERVVQG